MATHSSARARIEPAFLALAAMIGSVLGTTAAVAQEPAKVTVEVGRCAVLESPEERFACYEAAVDAAKEQPRAPEQPRAAATAQRPAAEGAPPPAQPTARGVQEAAGAPPPTQPTARVVEPTAGAPAAQDVATAQDERKGRAKRNPGQEFSGTVAALRETVPNAFVITLDNGQVWRQVRPKAYPLRSGEKVRLYSTGWGDSFRLETDSGRGYIQVERVN